MGGGNFELLATIVARMAGSDSTALSAVPREAEGSRAVRRLRRSGRVPGVVYGGGEPAVAFHVDSRELRNALAHAGAVLDLKIGDTGGTTVVLKELARHPVNGETLHLDLLRVRMDTAIQATVVLELTGTDDSPGVKQGGVLDQVTRELTIEALPGDIPDLLHHEASTLDIGDTITLAEIRPPAGVSFLDDPETVIASVTAPRLQLEDENEIEQETEVVGEGEASAEAEGDADSGGGEAADTSAE